jgi:hypothetical protein
VVGALDKRPNVFNPDQADLDHDGSGDARDPQTCGNGVVEARPGQGLPGRTSGDRGSLKSKSAVRPPRISAFS